MQQYFFARSCDALATQHCLAAQGTIVEAIEAAKDAKLPVKFVRARHPYSTTLSAYSRTSYATQSLPVFFRCV